MTVFKRSNLKVVFVGHVEDNLYVVDFSKEKTHLATCLMAKADVGWLWHRRLAHVGMRNLQALLKGEHILGLTNVSFAKERPCSACIARKLHEKAHKVKTIITTLRPLELIRLDLFGPPTYDSLGGRRYCLVIVDDFTRYTWVLFLLGFSFSRPKMKLKKPSSTLPKKLNVNITVRSRQSKVTMAPSSKTIQWMNS